jgi:hypothetical protein
MNGAQWIIRRPDSNLNIDASVLTGEMWAIYKDQMWRIMIANDIGKPCELMGYSRQQIIDIRNFLTAILEDSE